MAQLQTTRRGFLGRLGLISAGVVGWQAMGSVGLGYARPTADVDPADALRMLMDGNARYVAGMTTGEHRSADRRSEVARGQAPFATILSCSDSRVPPELVFDVGLGDIFTVRVAGNVVDDAVAGTVEYGAEHLHTPLIMVLGHERCGAVDAMVDAVTRGASFTGHIPPLIAPIRPAVEAARLQPGDLVDNAVRANIDLVTRQVRNAPELIGLQREGRLNVVGAYYQLATGQVSVIV